jgi:hypothetical protein
VASCSVNNKITIFNEAISVSPIKGADKFLNIVVINELSIVIFIFNSIIEASRVLKLSKNKISLSISSPTFIQVPLYNNSNGLLLFLKNNLNLKVGD